MQLTCPACAKTLEFSGEQPRFCGFCGQPLGTATPAPTEALSADVPTDDARTAEAVTVLPNLEISSGVKTAPPGDEAETVATATPALSPLDAGVPETVGGYRLLRKLGGGGMGAVYEAEDRTSGRRVALKLVLPEYAGSTDTLVRFRQEGRLASSLAHPRCVFVLAADEEAGRPYIVMELMPGDTLDDLVRQRGPLPVAEAIEKILDAIEGLDEAHRLGLVHRDVKPSNCFLEAGGRVKIGDFGLARSLVGDSKLTRTGAFVGTPLYAAPEQIHKKEPTDAQSDVYSVAATLYFLLTGRAPFQTGDSMATLARIVGDDAPSMRSLRPELPRALDKVVLRGLERDRRRRWKNVDDFRRALLPFLPARPSAVGLGLRFAAHLIDYVLLTLTGAAIGFMIAFLGPYPSSTIPVLLGSGSGIALHLGYYGTLEGIWGWSLGKWLLRVRVGKVRTMRPPGLGRAVLRAATLHFLLSLGTHVTQVLILTLDLTPRPGAIADPRAFWLMGIAVASGGWFWLALAAVLSTMRARNGYRGLHEFASGTYTFQLPWPRSSLRRQRIGHVGEFHVDVQPADHVPQRIGAFQVQGVLHADANERTLLAQDAQLGRTVWLWMRPAQMPALTGPQRDVSRATRQRWVACGSHDGWQWDAFLAPAGMPLAVFAQSQPRLTWTEFRPMLEELADELGTACGDGSLPRSLSVDQVWVLPNGRVMLLDAPLLGPTSPALRDAPPTADRADATDDERALRLLGAVAITALEGRPRAIAPKREGVRAPLPVHAAGMLGCLFGGERYRTIDELREDLAATRDRPTEVTRSRRFGHLGLASILLHLPSGGPTFIALIAFIFLYMTWDQPDRHRDPDAYIGIGVMALGWCVVWIVWAFAFRGGIAYWKAGIVLRRADGRKAARWQCGLRALVVWAPFAALLCGSLGACLFDPSLPWLYFGLWGIGAALLPLYVALALLIPARLIHDRIAGTYPVPD